MRWHLWIALGVLCIWLSVALAADQDGQQLEKQRARARELKAKMQQARTALRETLHREKEIMGLLDRIDLKLDRSRRTIRRLKQQIIKTQREIHQAQMQVQRLEREIRRLEGPFHARLVALYKTLRTGYPAFILSANRPNEAFRRTRYLLALVRQDISSLEHFQTKLQEQQQVRITLQERKDELLHIQRAQQDERRRILDQKNEKQRVLDELKQRKDLQEKTMGEFARAAAQLQELIRSLEELTRAASVIPSGTSGFGRLKGKLPLPVRGTVRTPFGKQAHPLLKTYTVQNGVEFQAAEGEEVKAVHAGTVVYAGWVRGYGNVLIIDHAGGYYTLFGHASRLLKKVGELVQEGEVVAYVGDTGSLTGPSLYFEIREGGKPVDPLAWIRVRR